MFAPTQSGIKLNIQTVLMLLESFIALNLEVNLALRFKGLISLSLKEPALIGR